MWTSTFPLGLKNSALVVYSLLLKCPVENISMAATELYNALAHRNWAAYQRSRPYSDIKIYL